MSTLWWVVLNTSFINSPPMDPFPDKTLGALASLLIEEFSRKDREKGNGIFENSLWTSSWLFDLVPYILFHSLSTPIFLCECMCMWACTHVWYMFFCVCKYMGMCAWWPEVGVRGLPLLLSTILFESGPFTEFGAGQWVPAHFPVSGHPVLRL